MTRGIVVMVLVLAAPLAQAQLGLPLRLPGLPTGGLAGLIDRTLPAPEDADDPTLLRDARRQRIAALLRRYPRLIERDPNGAPILASELLAFSPSDAVLARARAAGFGVLRERALAPLGARIVVLAAPARTSTRRALQELRAFDPSGTYDFNHLYFDSGTALAAPTPGREPGGTPIAPSPPALRAAASSAVAKLGLIDGGVDAHHPVFQGIAVKQYGCGGSLVPSAHGTEVASLMVGRAGDFRGAAPGADLYAADVYCGQPTGGAVDAIADAFAWLVSERVPVINVSLVGPPNALLERIVRAVIDGGSLIVAAVGNDGPAAPPLYPAAYPGVIGVTGVDAHRRALFEAERGPQVRFAAPGADMAAATMPAGYTTVRGTSFAAPIVAGLLGSELTAPDRVRAQRAIAELAQRAVHLGAPGANSVYGYGLVGADLRPAPALASAR